MHKYDKIYHPAEGKSQTDYYMDREGDLVGLTELSNRIVLTVEELREMWKACEDETWEDARPSNIYAIPGRLPGFEGYLRSKGINIEG